MASLFSDFLTSLGVRHTEEYSDRRFAEMPFQTMFGLTNLLKEYGVGTAGVKVAPGSRPDALKMFDTPYLIDTSDGFVIVQKIDNDKVTYMSQHKVFTAPLSEIAEGWNGIALLAATDSGSIEPDYERHLIGEMFNSVKKYVLRVAVALLLGFAMWASGLYRHWAAWCVVLFDCVGIYLSWMLLQKSAGVANKTADAVCSAIEEGGCDELAKSEAASFMGIFKWSELGMAYFSVSLLALLIFPESATALAAINILCLPYTIWSISYQKFRAKVWCTLCVCVQATLWLIFISYLAGGWTGKIFHAGPRFWITAAVASVTYLAALLGINMLDTSINKYFKLRNDDSTSDS